MRGWKEWELWRERPVERWANSTFLAQKVTGRLWPEINCGAMQRCRPFPLPPAPFSPQFPVPCPPRSPFDVLGVPVSADAEAIRSAYRKLALKWHPGKACRSLLFFLRIPVSLVCVWWGRKEGSAPSLSSSFLRHFVCGRHWLCEECSSPPSHVGAVSFARHCFGCVMRREPPLSRVPLRCPSSCVICGDVRQEPGVRGGGHREV